MAFLVGWADLVGDGVEVIVGHAGFEDGEFPSNYSNVLHSFIPEVARDVHDVFQRCYRVVAFPHTFAPSLDTAGGTSAKLNFTLQTLPHERQHPPDELHGPPQKSMRQRPQEHVRLPHAQQAVVQFQKYGEFEPQRLTYLLPLRLLPRVSFRLPPLLAHELQRLLDSLAEFGEAELVVDWKIPPLVVVDRGGMLVQPGLGPFHRFGIQVGFVIQVREVAELAIVPRLLLRVASRRRRMRPREQIPRQLGEERVQSAVVRLEHVGDPRRENGHLNARIGHQRRRHRYPHPARDQIDRHLGRPSIGTIVIGEHALARPQYRSVHVLHRGGHVVQQEEQSGAFPSRSALVQLAHGELAP
mmetsp:Transcript_31284/g.57266  ORF Transcript_31284/g.57266 Transcript_31284/m.57266 type:complete len:356 (-) Transcript_31284:203-1270(-)